MKRLFILLLSAVVFASGCGADYDTELAKRLNEEPAELEYREEKSRAAAVLEEMSLEDKLWQMFFVTPEAVSGGSADTSVTDAFSENAKVRRVGGIILFENNIYSEAQVSEFLADISACFDIPVFLGVDEEGGSVSRLGKKGIITDNGNMSRIGASGDTSAAAEVGERLGTELGGLGFNLDFAPVADILTNPYNTEIGVRSFGNDAETVSGMVAAEVAAMQECGVSAVIKHFPGHGGTLTNSHKGTSVNQRTLEQLRAEDLKSFEAGIEAGADFVMVSHMSLPNVVGDSTPCSLSRRIITELLKEELGFDGVAVTDALNMGAVTNIYSPAEAAVKAVEAGADMLLMPDDLMSAYNGLLAAVKDGRVSEDRIDESVTRILKIKEKRGLI